MKKIDYKRIEMYFNKIEKLEIEKIHCYRQILKLSLGDKRI